MADRAGTRPRILVVESAGELAEKVTAAAGALEPVPEVFARPSLAPGEPAGFDLLVAGPSMLTGAGLRQLATRHSRVPATAVIAVLDRRPGADLREIVRIGADDALSFDVTEDELTLTLERVLALARRRSGRDAVADAEGVSTPGRVIAVVSPTEGCGKTFLAANTALFLARSPGVKVVLVDLDLQFGEVRTALRAKADFSIVDALRSEAEGHDLEVVLPDLMARHASGFSILAAPRDPAEADSVAPGDVARVIEALRAHADYVVLDSPSGLAEHMLPALDLTDSLVVVATADRPSTHNVGVFLNTIERLGIGSDIAIVLNKVEPHSDLAAARAALPLTVQTVLPYDRHVARSINLGVPLLEGTPASPAARELLAFLPSLLPGAPPSAIPDTAHDHSEPSRPVLEGRRPAETAPVLADEDWTNSPAAGSDDPIDGWAGDPAMPDFQESHDPSVASGRRRGTSGGSGLRPCSPRRRPPAGRPATRPGWRQPALRKRRRSRAPPGSGRNRPKRPTTSPFGPTKWHSVAIEDGDGGADNSLQKRSCRPRCHFSTCLSRPRWPPTFFGDSCFSAGPPRCLSLAWPFS